MRASIPGLAGGYWRTTLQLGIDRLISAACASVTRDPETNNVNRDRATTMGLGAVTLTYRAYNF
jgi:hypothetical protein